MTSGTPRSSPSAIEGGSDAHDRDRPGARVILVNMPWHKIHYPSLALSLLKPILTERGHDVRIMNGNIPMSRLIGDDLYASLADGDDGQVGEQAFAQLLHPEQARDPAFVAFMERRMPFAEFEELVERGRDLVANLAAQIAASKPDLVGFTTTFHQKAASLALAAALRQVCPDAIVVFGGGACEQPMGTALLEAYPQIDVAFHGAADASLPDFVDYIAGRRPGPEGLTGLIYRDDATGAIRTGPPPPQVDLNTLPLPDIGDYQRDMDEAGLLEAVDWRLVYETSRGCWWGEKNHCTFCGLNGEQMRFRAKRPELVLDQLRQLHAIAGDRLVLFSDNILHHTFHKSLVPKLGSIGGLRYFFEIKSNLTEEQVAELRANNVQELQPGIERISTHVLRLMKKGGSAPQNIQLLRWAAEYGIGLHWNFLYGFVGENAEDVDRERALIAQIRHLPPPGAATPIRLDRYSPNHRDPEKHGLRILGPSEGEAYLFRDVPDPMRAAYHFEHEWIEPPPPALEAAWKELTADVRSWREDYVPKRLTARAEGPDRIVITDRRKPGEGTEVVLEGDAADVYRLCNRFQPLWRLERAMSGAQGVIDDLSDHGLLVRQDDWVLAAAVREGLEPGAAATGGDSTRTVVPA